MEDAYDSRDRRSNCPACGEEIRRVPRTEADHAGRYATQMRRYACTSASCGWQGLLPRQPTSQRTLEAVAEAAKPNRAREWFKAVRPALPLALAGLAGAVLASAAMWQLLPHAEPAPHAGGKFLAPGEHHEGVAMNPQHPLLKAEDGAPAEIERLALRQGCAWGRPGTNPYRGTVDQALVTAKLPPEVVQRIAMKVQAGQLDDRLEITNAGIRTHKDEREFEPRNVAMTYGKTLCVNTRVNFKAGHVERASLYEASDKRGNLYSVMVPDVCGNVSVLGARLERNRKRVPLPVLAETAHGGPALLRLMAADPDDPAHAVPEPGTLACVLAALLALGWRLRRRPQRLPPIGRR